LILSVTWVIVKRYTLIDDGDLRKVVSAAVSPSADLPAMTSPTRQGGGRAEYAARALQELVEQAAQMLAAVKTGHLTAAQVLIRAETDPIARRTPITAPPKAGAAAGIGDRSVRQPGWLVWA